MVTPEGFMQGLVIAQALAFFIALPLLALYFRERVKNLAREATERALADYKHTHDAELAALNASHQRQLQQFGLYTTKRHATYGALYRRMRIASDAYGSLSGLTVSPDFRRYTVEDATAYFARHKVPSSATRAIIAAFENGKAPEAAILLDKLDTHVKVHFAAKAFAGAKNIEAAREMYLSDAVRTQMEVFRSATARFSVVVEREDGLDPKELEKKEAMQEAVQGMFRLMREEMAFEPSNPAS